MAKDKDKISTEKIEWKELGPDSPIFKGGFRIHTFSSKEDYIAKREKETGLKNIFFEEINPNLSIDNLKKSLIKILKKNGWKMKK
tara:strand:+ start:97 stop:351 length:255 start_codon:yes stop_codon:yes gene_type:complete